MFKNQFVCNELWPFIKLLFDIFGVKFRRFDAEYVFDKMLNLFFLFKKVFYIKAFSSDRKW